MVQKWRAGVCVLSAAWVAATCLNRAPIQAAQSTQSVSVAPAAQRAVFKQYCLTCHSEALKKAGTVPIALDSDTLWDIAASAPTWEKVVLKMRAGVMPPAKASSIASRRRGRTRVVPNRSTA